MSFVSEMLRVGKDAAIYGISSGISRMMVLMMAPILTRVFAPDDYGIIALIQIAVSLFVIIAGMNIISGMSYYYYHLDDKGERKSVLTTGIISIGFFSLLISGILYFFADEIALQLQAYSQNQIKYELGTYLRIASLGLLFSLLVTGFQMILRLDREPIKYMQVEILIILTNVLSVLTLVVWLQWGIQGVFWSNVIAPVFGCLLGLYYTADKLGRNPTFVLLGLILVFSLPLIPAALLNWIQGQLGHVFLNYYRTLAELGIYSIAFAIGSILFLVSTAFRLAYDPYALSIMKRDDAAETYAKIYGLYSVALCCLVGIIGAFAKPILIILTPVDYHSAYEPIIFILVANLYMSVNNILLTGVWIKRKTIFTTYAQFISFFVLVVTSFIFIPAYGIVGASVSYLCGTVAQSLAYYYFAQRLWYIPYQYWKINLLIMIILITGILHNHFVMDLDFWEAIVISITTSSFVIVICWRYSPENINEFFRVAKENK